MHGDHTEPSVADDAWQDGVRAMLDAPDDPDSVAVIRLGIASLKAAAESPTAMRRLEHEVRRLTRELVRDVRSVLT